MQGVPRRGFGGDGGWRAPPPRAAPSVAVVGAGIGGAALALALQQRGVRVALFDKDAGFASRKQGYGLTMQKYSGRGWARSA